jgi:hypothetical protein
MSMKTSVKILLQARIPKDDVRLQAVSPERDRFTSLAMAVSSAHSPLAGGVHT